MLINRLLLFLIIVPGLLLSQLKTGYAQTNEGADITVNVSAEITSTIEVITIQSMDLAETEAINDRITVNPQQSPNAGKMIAIGNPDSEIRISYLEQRELTEVNGTNNLIFNYEVAGNEQDDQSSAELLSQENRDFELNDEGRFYLWVGGSVDISTVGPGNYEGDFTVEIEYI